LALRRPSERHSGDFRGDDVRTPCRPHAEEARFHAPVGAPTPSQDRRSRPGGVQKNFAATVAVALPDAAAGKPIEVWFQDEARVGQQGTLTRLWARRGSRPRAVRDTRYQWAYIFGAALVMPYADTEAMNVHLVEISRCVAEGAHAVLVLDGAG
jgi:hypothetical protein